jgi:hypothetical protein
MLLCALRCISMHMGENYIFARHVQYSKRRPNILRDGSGTRSGNNVNLHVVLFDLVFLGELGDHICDLKFLLLRSSSKRLTCLIIVILLD